MGRHHYDLSRSPDTYGRHSEANAGGLTVAALLRRVVASGEAIRLAWPVEGADQLTGDDEWPTAVLPKVEEQAGELPVQDRSAWR
jgi:hypothetical protein